MKRILACFFVISLCFSQLHASVVRANDGKSGHRIHRSLSDGNLTQMRQTHHGFLSGSTSITSDTESIFVDTQEGERGRSHIFNPVPDLRLALGGNLSKHHGTPYDSPRDYPWDGSLSDLATSTPREKQLKRYEQLQSELLSHRRKIETINYQMSYIDRFFNQKIGYPDERDQLTKELRHQDAILVLDEERVFTEQKILAIRRELLALQTLLEIPFAELEKKYHKRAKIIFCLSGGGIRGLMEVVYLQLLLRDIRLKASHLEFPGAEELEYADLIDAVAGTSTGSFIAGAIAYRKDLQTVRELYESGEAIFEKRRCNFGGLRGSIYKNGKNSPLATTLDAMLSHPDGTPYLLSEAQIPIFVPTLLVDRSKLHIFDSTKASMDPTNKCTISEALQGSSAAPYYFSSRLLPTMQGRVREHWDGGIAGANDPSLIGLYSTLDYFKSVHDEILTPHNIIMMTLGSGQTASDHPSMRNKGILVARSIIEGLMAGGSDTTHQAMKHLLLDDRYYPVDFMISEKHAALDSYKEESIHHFVNVAEETYYTNKSSNDRLIMVILDIYRERLAEKSLLTELSNFAQHQKAPSTTPKVMIANPANTNIPEASVPTSSASSTHYEDLPSSRIWSNPPSLINDQNEAASSGMSCSQTPFALVGGSQRGDVGLCESSFSLASTPSSTHGVGSGEKAGEDNTVQQLTGTQATDAAQQFFQLHRQSTYNLLSSYTMDLNRTHNSDGGPRQ